MEGSQPEGSEADSGSRPKRVSTKKKRIIVVAAVVVIVAMIVALWGTQPQRTYRPGEILASPNDFVGKTVQVRGLASSWDNKTNTFNLTDYDEVTNLTVKYSVLPEAFEVGKEIIVRGTLQGGDGGWVFVAQDVRVGHAGG